MKKKKKVKIFVGLYSDLVFKYIFGTTKNIKFTLELLEVIFNLEKCSLNGIIKNSVTLDREHVKNKRFETDVVFVSSSGNIINLEMRNLNDKNSEIKHLMYVTSLFSGQLNSGELYNNVKNVLQIVFIKNDRIERNISSLINNYMLINKKDLLDSLGDEKLEVINVFVDKINTFRYNENIKLSLWIKLIKADTKEEVENVRRESIEQKYEIIEEVLKKMESFTSKEYVQDYSRQEALIKSQMISACEYGESRKQLEIARNLVENTDMSFEVISNCTGLAVEELKKIKSKKLC